MTSAAPDLEDLLAAAGRERFQAGLPGLVLPRVGDEVVGLADAVVEVFRIVHCDSMIGDRTLNTRSARPVPFQWRVLAMAILAILRMSRNADRGFLPHRAEIAAS